jgi:hypothetical protein
MSTRHKSLAIVGLVLSASATLLATKSFADEWCYYSSGAADPDCLARNEAADAYRHNYGSYYYGNGYIVSNQWYVDASGSYYWMYDAGTGLYWYYYPATGTYAYARA